MATTITIDPKAKPTLSTLVDLTKQALIVENVGGSPGAAALAAVRGTYLRACELWPASMHVAAAIVANASTFTSATLDALGEASAP